MCLEGWMFQYFISDRISLPSEEGKSVTLKPSQNAKDLSCSTIRWFKYIMMGVFVDIALSEGNDDEFYFGDYCESSSPCKGTSKVELNTRSGRLTIHELQMTDDFDYYILCNISGHEPHYELLRLEIYGT